MTSQEIPESQVLLFKKILAYAAYIRMSSINRTHNLPQEQSYKNGTY